MIDLNPYIGVPWVAGGRSPAGWDCYGLVKYLYKTHRNIDLPDWAVDARDIRQVATIMSDATKDELQAGRAEEIDQPEDWAIVMSVRHRAAHHMGVCFGDGVIHAVERMQTHFDPWSRFERLFVRDGMRLYRWHR